MKNAQFNNEDNIIDPTFPVEDRYRYNSDQFGNNASLLGETTPHVDQV